MLQKQYNKGHVLCMELAELITNERTKQGLLQTAMHTERIYLTLYNYYCQNPSFQPEAQALVERLHEQPWEDDKTAVSRHIANALETLLDK